MSWLMDWLPVVPGWAYRRSERRRLKVTRDLEILQTKFARLAELDAARVDRLADCLDCPYRQQREAMRRAVW